MNEFYVRNVLEAALLAAGKPLQLNELGQLFEESTRPKAEELRAALDALAGEYANRGVELKETAAGFRIQVRREFSPEISRLWPERPARYSRALLETLALVAYRQPITRAEIEAVRGVAVNPNIIKTLIERSWVRVVGHRDVPGRPELLGTTREFLDYFGLRSLDELPPLAEIKAMGDYNLQLELPSAGLPSTVSGSSEQTPDGEGGEGVDAPAAVASADEAVEAGAAPDAAAAAGFDVVTVEGALVESVDSEAPASLEEAAARGPGMDGAEFAQAEVTQGTKVSDAVEDSAEDDADDEELSADGHDSRELVAGPRDMGD